MSRFGRLIVFFTGASGVAVLLLLSFTGLPRFGGDRHPYRDATVAAAKEHATANAVASVTFDSRGIDTFGEETILLASVVGASVLLRRERGEHDEQTRAGRGRVLDSTGLVGYGLLGLTLLVGLSVVAHGHLTPGGGFQGGALLATGLHLLYVAGRYPALERLRPVELFDIAEAAGEAAFAGLGVAGIAGGGAFLANMLPKGTFGQLLSAGTVPVLSVAAGLEVGAGIVVLLSHFLEQDLHITGRSGA